MESIGVDWGCFISVLEPGMTSRLRYCFFFSFFSIFRYFFYFSIFFSFFLLISKMLSVGRDVGILNKQIVGILNKQIVGIWY